MPDLNTILAKQLGRKSPKFNEHRIKKALEKTVTRLKKEGARFGPAVAPFKNPTTDQLWLACEPSVRHGKPSDFLHSVIIKGKHYVVEWAGCGSGSGSSGHEKYLEEFGLTELIPRGTIWRRPVPPKHADANEPKLVRRCGTDEWYWLGREFCYSKRKLYTRSRLLP